MKKTFVNAAKPMYVASLRHKTIDDAINDVRLGDTLGADGYLIHAEFLDEKSRDGESLARLYAATEKPIMTLNYRVTGKEDDNELAAYLLDSIKRGAAAVDLPAIFFDMEEKGRLSDCSAPYAKAGVYDVTARQEAVKKQKEFIKKAHDLGAEVLMSAHVGVELYGEEALSLAEEIKDRGADIVKIIVSCGSPQSLLKVLETDLLLHDKLNKPYLYQCNGTYGAFSRLASPKFGSGYLLCHTRYGENSNREKPLISDAKAAVDSIKWSLG